MTSALTFAASANCGAYLGATPRFADIDAETWNVSAATIARAATDRTQVVVPVHFAGLPAPVGEIRNALGPGVAMVEDAAHALGARSDGEPVGSCGHSDMAVFSFHPVKAITTGEGGVVTTRKGELRDRLRQFRNHGLVRDPEQLEQDEGGWYLEQQVLGFNYRLSDVHSALGARSSRSSRASWPGVTRSPSATGSHSRTSSRSSFLRRHRGSLHAYHLFIIRHRDGAKARRRLYDGLHDRGIRPGPLPPGLFTPLVPRCLRLRAWALPGGRGVLRGLFDAPLLSGPHRRRPAHGHRGGPGAGLVAFPGEFRIGEHPVGPGHPAT